MSYKFTLSAFLGGLYSYLLLLHLYYHKRSMFDGCIERNST